MMASFMRVYYGISLCFIKENVLSPSIVHSLPPPRIYPRLLSCTCVFLVTAIHIWSVAPCVWKWKRFTTQLSQNHNLENWWIDYEFVLPGESSTYLASENGVELEFCSNEVVTWLIVTKASFRVPRVICLCVFTKCGYNRSLYTEIEEQIVLT